jgi:glutamyl-tRNA reductase
MQVRDMNLVHHLKQGPNESLQLSAPHLFHLDTCQRELWITERQSDTTGQGISTYSGEAAYKMLLSIACGLESRVVGETEVFAQLKSAWRNLENSADANALLTALFEDAKFIRTNYVSGMGGQSYGTLVRKCISPVKDSNVLIAGAGESGVGKH